MNEEKIIKDLGSRSGSLLFFGGVYSNLQALQALQQWALNEDYTPDRIFSIGDVLGYCAQPLECIHLMQQWKITSIAGNVELQLREGEDDCGCNFNSGGRCDLLSRNWYAYTKRQLNAEALSWLHTLPHHVQFSYGGKKITLVHGSWHHTSEFIFASTPWDVKKESFTASGADLIVAGHCGLPFADEGEGRLWLNPGVIGMPANDGTDSVWFLTLNENERDGITYRFHRLQYDNARASALMQERGLPPSYAETLQTGIWDNCEILPAAEKAAQGIKIVL